MGKLNNLLAGLGGAIALNLLHEGLKNQDRDMPRVDLLGEEALTRGLSWFGAGIKDPDKLYQATLAGDVVGNALYYSLIGTGGKKYIWSKAVVLGLAAGLGAVTLPAPMGLDDRPVARNMKVKILTVGYYLAGALVTALILSKSKKF
jgi:hypothetical protein